MLKVMEGFGKLPNCFKNVTASRGMKLIHVGYLRCYKRKHDILY